MTEYKKLAVSQDFKRAIVTNGDKYAIIRTTNDSVVGKWRDERLLKSMLSNGSFTEYTESMEKSMPKRKSVSSTDTPTKGKKNTITPKTADLIVQLGLENFSADVTNPNVWKSTEELLVIDMAKAQHSHLPDGSERYSYKCTENYNIVYIPVNRLKEVYQTGEALNQSTINRKAKEMKSGKAMPPVFIGYNYDVHDGHHSWNAAIKNGYTHVPCKVVGSDPKKVRDAIDEYKKVWKSLKDEPKLVIDTDPDDLFKSVLNTGKLVRRMVQVRGKNGKIFPRMQWVNPEDASSGHGVREINSEQHLHEAIKQGIDKHPDFHASLKHQGVVLEENHDRQHSFKDSPSFFLPETKESSDHAKKGNLDNHIPHKQETPNPTQESTKAETPRPAQESTKAETSSPRIRNVMDTIDQHQFSSSSNAERLQELEQVLRKHWDSDIAPELEEHINNNSENEASKKAQLHKLRKTKSMIFSDSSSVSNLNHVVYSHPDVTKGALSKIWGKEVLDKKLGDLRKNASFTINLSSSNTSSVEKSGYIGSISNFLSNVSDNSLTDEEYNSTISRLYKENGNDPDQVIKALSREVAEGDALSPDKGWHDVLERISVEWSGTGAEPNAPRPVYMAYNPTSDPEMLEEYGDSCLKIDPSIIHGCTATDEDSYAMNHNGIPSVMSEDHVHLSYLAKILTNGEPEEEGDYPSIPFELQYHHPESIIDKSRITSI